MVPLGIKLAPPVFIPCGGAKVPPCGGAGANCGAPALADCPPGTKPAAYTFIVNDPAATFILGGAEAPPGAPAGLLVWVGGWNSVTLPEPEG
jgi:hypothetical protein